VHEAAETALEKMMNQFEEELDPDRIKNKLFKELLQVQALSSLPSHPNEINLSEANCTNEQQIEQFFSDLPGLKMMFVKGKLYSTNILLQDNEFEYYRLIGEAYNNHLLDRASLSKLNTTSLFSKLS
jgi:hypothetical protein